MNPVNGSANKQMIAAWRRIFASTRPGDGYPSTLAFQYPFAHQDVEAIVILYPLTGYLLTRRQHASLKSARDKIVPSEKVIYVSTYEDQSDFLHSSSVRGDARHYELATTEDYAAYERTVPWPLEYAMYGSSGAWGLIVSHEMHAVLGGSRALIDDFKRRYDRWESDVAELKYYWKDNPNGRWVNDLLARMPEAAHIAAAPRPDERDEDE